MGRNVRLRSANRGNANNVFNVNSDGNVNNWNATNTLRSAPDWTAASPQRLLRNKGWAQNRRARSRVPCLPISDR
nr:MAG TPA_asm: hypothetical protein [Caudoviricetes sp.]